MSVFRDLSYEADCSETYGKRSDGTAYQRMILVPLFSMILVYLYCVSGESFFTGTWIFGELFSAWLLLLAINIYCLYVWYDLAENQRAEAQGRIDETAE